MATYYVDNAAAGTGDGSSKVNAATSLVTLLGAVTEATGDLVLISHTHTETLAAQLGANLNAAGSNRGIRFQSVNFSTDAPTFGATFTVAGQTIQLPGIVEGVHFDNSATAGALPVVPQQETVYIGCKFSKQAAQQITFGAWSARLIGCEIAAGTSYTVVLGSSAGQVNLDLVGCTITGTKGADAILYTQGSSAHNPVIRVFNTDLSGIDTVVDHVVGGANGSAIVRLINCKLPASLVVERGMTRIDRKGGLVEMTNCLAGVAAAPLIGCERYSHFGQCTVQTTKYRDNGTTDGTTPHSWSMMAYDGRTWKQSPVAAISPFVEIPVTTSDDTLEFYVAHDGVGAGTAGALKDDEFWVQVLVPTTSAAGTLVTSMRALTGTAADIPADAGSTWTGDNLGTKQKITVAITPGLAGSALAQFFFAPQQAADKTISVDIAPVVS